MLSLAAPPSLRDLCALVLLLAALPSSRAAAQSLTPASSSNLDLSELGRVALVGDFDSVSLYDYVGQGEDALFGNGSQALLGRYASGAFANLDTADAYIMSMCSYVSSSGDMNGVIVAGNFTSLGGQPAQAVALYDPSTGTVTPLDGIDGQVSAVYCDSDTSTVFVGGSFTGAASTNALAWTNQWTNLPFAGFNGPVNAIQKLPNGNIVFAGSFDGLSNMTAPTVPDAQVVNVGSANVTATPTSDVAQYNDPASIFCATSDASSPGTNWLLPNVSVGSWTAHFGFTFRPTKLRLLNAQVPDWGTREWNFIDLNSGGILEFNYVANGTMQSCSRPCPLAQNSSYQDFYFVNNVPIDSFTIAINAWYGNGAGLAGIELFQDDIYSFAIESFNEPRCDHVSPGANATATGPWTVTPSGDSNSDYLSTYLSNGTGATSADAAGPSVVFMPNIQQSGNYSISLFTPGCLSDDTCDTRGSVVVSGSLGNTPGSAPSTLEPTTVFQTNQIHKYDPIYYGYVEANTGSFGPAITLVPSANQTMPLTVVAQAIQFQLVSSTGGLNGLYEYDPSQLVSDATDFSHSSIDYAGIELNPGADILTLAVAGDLTYAAGSFSSDSLENILSITNGNITSLGGGGLNDVVQTMYWNNSILYIGGNFTNTRDGTVSGLGSVAAYSTSSQTWMPLGAGVNGMVTNIVPLAVNISSDSPTQCVAVSGYFDAVLGFGDNAQSAADNIAIWVPSRNNWLQNLDASTFALSGRLNAQTTVPNSDPLFAGSVSSQALSAGNVVGVSDALALQQLPLNFVPDDSSDASQAASGIVTGMFYETNGLNITVLGGSFSANASNGTTVSNLVLVNNTAGTQVTGLADNSNSSGAAILAMDTYQTTLFAGGSISQGVVAYDLATGKLSPIQPASLSGGNTTTVNAVAVRPSSPAVWIAGSFDSAGSLPCPALCIYDAALKQWNAPASGLTSSSTVAAMMWATDTRLILAGDMTINGQRTAFASYDQSTSTFTSFSGAAISSSAIPGPITAFTATDNSYESFFATGVSSSNNSAFLMFYSGPSKSWSSVTGFDGASSTVEGLQVLSLSSSSSSSSSFLASSQTLLVTGALSLPQFGNVSAALFDGSSFIPFALTNRADGSPGSLRRAFVQNPQNLLNSTEHHLALGFIVLIGLAIALALIFLLVVAGIVAERMRRRREGYVPAPQPHPSMFEKHGAGGALNPAALFGSLGGARDTGSGHRASSRLAGPEYARSAGSDSGGYDTAEQ